MSIQELNIRELTIYKVNVQSIDTGTRIEGFYCQSFMFLDYEKAMDFAFDFAKKCAIRTGRMPIYDDDDMYDDPVVADPAKLVKHEQYMWPDNSYTHWNKVEINVVEDKLEFDKNIMNYTTFEM